MASEKITIANIRRRRSFGVGVSTSPANDGTTRILPPSSPDWVGSYREVKEKSEQYMHQLGGVYHAVQWFYQGRPIVSPDCFAIDWDLEWTYDEDRPLTIEVEND